MENEGEKNEIITRIKNIENSKRKAVQKRVLKALNILEDGNRLPKGWDKRNI